MKRNCLISTEIRYKPCFNGYNGIIEVIKVYNGNIKRSHSFLLNVLGLIKLICAFQNLHKFFKEMFNMLITKYQNVKQEGILLEAQVYLLLHRKKYYFHFFFIYKFRSIRVKCSDKNSLMNT